MSISKKVEFIVPNRVVDVLRICIVMLICFVSIPSVFAKNVSQTKPLWLLGEMPPKSNNSYHFVVIEGNGANYGEARKDCDLGIVNTLVREAGITVSGKQIEKTLFSMNNGHYDEFTSSDYNYEFEFDNVKISFKAVDQFYEIVNNEYNLHILYEVPSDFDKKCKYDNVETTRNYGITPLFYSIIPGGGQMVKKQYLKGCLFFAADAALITTSLIYENQRSSYISKMKSTIYPEAYRFYENKANKARQIRNICLIGAGATYIYNLLDAALAKGKLKYVKPTVQFASMDMRTGDLAYFNLSVEFSF